MNHLPHNKKVLKNLLIGNTARRVIGGAMIGASMINASSVNAATHTYTKTENPVLPYPSNTSVYRAPNHTNDASNDFVVVTGDTCAHASGVVNGHYNFTPVVNPTQTIYKLTNTHGSHGSHGSHCSGCRSCSNW